jgi:acyl-CoA reductase-like NAD-dependent aldehyde dehydrogenase
LKDLLLKALDQDTFAISTRRVKIPDIESFYLVDQTQSAPSLISKSNEIISNLQTRTLAIVDRTADVEAAAKAIVAARFNFQGTSPYAPDLVIVNDFVKKGFFEAATRFASQVFAGRKTGKGPIGVARSMNEETRTAIKEAEAKGEVSSFGSSDFKILDISDK